MKIGILGGGPGGLYLGILLKKANPTHDVSIVERNPPGATFGWGVVFSDETLGYLEDNDYETYLAITSTFAKWDALEVRFGGEVIRSTGHGFSGIARRRLLQILHARCEQLGVKVTFNTKVDDLSPFAGCDLIVAADGVNSKIRKAHEHVHRRVRRGDLAAGRPGSGERGRKPGLLPAGLRRRPGR